ncbi:MAG: ATP-dependent 6-phosphofructokinase [Holosporales bacterium]|jgi:6-phosphofructokinase 1|nr:ATP-dependent 6-phosphofructokinase [Holosporales bacterium]
MYRKKIGILTSGGDCSGLNCVIRAAYLRSKALGYSLIGIKRGLRGLIERPANIVELNNEICNDSLLTKSGSILLSNTKALAKNNGEQYTNEECTELVVGGYHSLGLSGLIFIGGDGSISLLNRLLIKNSELNVVVIPKTIDNDVPETDIAIGFSTVVEVVSEAIANIRTTAASHERSVVVEVMGRDAGFIAMYAGVAAGADIILTPEFKYDAIKLIENVQKCYASGKDHCVIVVAEAVESATFKAEKNYNGVGEYVASILKHNGFDVRTVVLGHTQRGGKTSVIDRIVGSAFGVTAVNLINSDNSGVMLSYARGELKPIPLSLISGVDNKKLSKNDVCVRIARDFGVYIGENVVNEDKV